VEVTRVDADRFGHAGACSRQEEQKSSVAPTSVRRLIRARDNGVDLGVGEVVRHLDVGPLGGDCQNALGDAEGSGIVGCDVMEEGSHSGKAGIARCDGVAPLLLELVEKGENEVPIELLELKRRRFLAQSGGGKEDQHAQGIAIAGHGRRRGVTLLGQPPTEVRLQEWRETKLLAHAAPPSMKARSAAAARRSDEPVR
jgi:hypothetical protein